MKLEFSKVVLAAVVLVYISTVIYAYFVVVNAPELLGALLTFVGTPTSAAIGFYCWKAKCENIIKLDKNAGSKITDAFVAGSSENTDGGDNDAMG